MISMNQSVALSMARHMSEHGREEAAVPASARQSSNAWRCLTNPKRNLNLVGQGKKKAAKKAQQREREADFS